MIQTLGKSGTGQHKLTGSDIEIDDKPGGISPIHLGSFFFFFFFFFFVFEFDQIHCDPILLVRLHF